MYPFGGILIAPIIAGYIAYVLFRAQRRWGRPSGILFNVIPILAGVLASWLFMFQLDLFTRAWWTHGKVGGWTMLLISGMPSVVVSLVAARMTLAHCRRNVDGAHPSG